MGRARGIAATAAALLAAGCLSSCKGKGASESGGVDFPVRVGVNANGEGDATALVSVGRLVDGDGQALQIDLQRTPPAGTANLWACWDLPAETQPVGRAVCLSDPAKSFELTAANVVFLCRTNAEYGVNPPRAAAALAGCDAYEVFAYQFEPPLFLELAGRK